MESLQRGHRQLVTSYCFHMCHSENDQMKKKKDKTCLFPFWNLPSVVAREETVTTGSGFGINRGLVCFLISSWSHLWTGEWGHFAGQTPQRRQIWFKLMYFGSLKFKGMKATVNELQVNVTVLRMNMTREQEPMSQVSEKLKMWGKSLLTHCFYTVKKRVFYRIVRVGREVQIFF